MMLQCKVNSNRFTELNHQKLMINTTYKIYIFMKNKLNIYLDYTMRNVFQVSKLLTVVPQLQLLNEMALNCAGIHFAVCFCSNCHGQIIRWVSPPRETARALTVSYLFVLILHWHRTPCSVLYVPSRVAILLHTSCCHSSQSSLRKSTALTQRFLFMYVLTLKHWQYKNTLCLEEKNTWENCQRW